MFKPCATQPCHAYVGTILRVCDYVTSMINDDIRNPRRAAAVISIEMMSHSRPYDHKHKSKSPNIIILSLIDVGDLCTRKGTNPDRRLTPASHSRLSQLCPHSPGSADTTLWQPQSCLWALTPRPRPFTAQPLSARSTELWMADCRICPHSSCT